MLPERLVGRVDLGHPAGLDPGVDRVARRDVGVVLPGQPSPGCLDRARRGAGLQPEHEVGIALRHAFESSHPGRTGSPRAAGLTPASTCRPLSSCRLSAAPASIAGLTIAPLAAAFRFAHVYRARAGFPHRRPPRFSPADFGLAYEEMTVASDAGDLPAWFIPAAGGALGPGGRARPRLGLGPRPDPADRLVPPCGRVPLPDVRRPRQRRQPARAPPGQHRRVRRRRGGGVRGPARPARGEPGRDRRAFDGRRRRDPRRGRGLAGRRGGQRVGAVGPAADGPPDVPPRPAPLPRCRRHAARLAHEPGVRPAARARPARDQRPPRDRDATPARCWSPTAGTTRSCPSSTPAGSPARRSPRGRASAPRPRSSC